MGWGGIGRGETGVGGVVLFRVVTLVFTLAYTLAFTLVFTLVFGDITFVLCADLNPPAAASSSKWRALPTCTLDLLWTHLQPAHRRIITRTWTEWADPLLTVQAGHCCALPAVEDEQGCDDDEDGAGNGDGEEKDARIFSATTEQERRAHGRPAVGWEKGVTYARESE